MTKKKIYILGAVLILIADCVIAALYIRYEAPEVILTPTPNKAVGIVAPTPELKKIIVTKPIWQRSLFAAYRGVVKAPKGPVAPSGRTATMELIGICQLGKNSGAIIIDKSIKRSPGARKKNFRRYYALNQTMDSGFVVKEIQKDFVRLVRGHEELVLDLVFGDVASSGRNIRETEIQIQAQREIEKFELDHVMSREEMMNAMREDNLSRETDVVPQKIIVKDEVKATKDARKVKAERLEIGRRLEALRRKLSLQR